MGEGRARDLEVGAFGIVVISDLEGELQKEEWKDFGILRADFGLERVQTERWSLEEVERGLGGPIPKRLVMGVKDGNQPVLGFLSETDHQGAYQSTGVYITTQKNQSNLFSVQDLGKE